VAERGGKKNSTGQKTGAGRRRGGLQDTNRREKKGRGLRGVSSEKAGLALSIFQDNSSRWGGKKKKTSRKKKKKGTDPKKEVYEKEKEGGGHGPTWKTRFPWTWE